MDHLVQRHAFLRVLSAWLWHWWLLLDGGGAAEASDALRSLLPAVLRALRRCPYTPQARLPCPAGFGVGWRGRAT